MMSFWPRSLAVLCYFVLPAGAAVLRTSRKGKAGRGAESITDFARQQGVAVDLVRIQSFNHGGVQVRGLAVVKDLPENTTVISVPPSGQLGRTTEIVSEFFGPWAPGNDRISGWRLLCALAVERALGERSVWYPYIKHLPSLSDFQRDQLLFAPPKLLQHFSVLPATQKISELRSWLEADIAAWGHWMSITSPDWRNGTDEAAHVRDMRLMASQVRQEDLEWAFGVLTTRAFKKPNVGPVLVPLVDDINTDDISRRNAEWVESQDKLEVRTTRLVLAGEELIMRYTTEEVNGQYAAEWGFLLPGIPTEPLSASNCSTMFPSGTSSSACTPPASETHPQSWCLLENLARKSCQPSKR